MPQKSMLLQLLEPGFAHSVLSDQRRQDRGLLTDYVQFPFTAILKQDEMKLALVLTVINPRVGGVLLIGPRGTAKTTAVRGLIDLLPPVERSLCPYGCEPQDAETGGMDAVCTDCATKLAHGDPITRTDRMQLIELPLNARLDDVIGGINERAAVEHQRVRIEKGILAKADKNILFVDEINLLEPSIANAILDAAAQGRYTVHRGALTATYRARIILIGSMNPEEGELRPQIMDRLGLRVIVKRLDQAQDRVEVYHRMLRFAKAPYAMIEDYAEDLLAMSDEIDEAQGLVPHVTVTPPAENLIMEAILRLNISSNRTEYVALEAARAYAAADGRTMATDDDARAVAPMALRLRRSEFIDRYFEQTMDQERTIQEVLASL